MTAACTCGQRHTTWTNDKDVSNEGHSVACPANPQFAKPSTAQGYDPVTFEDLTETLRDLKRWLEFGDIEAGVGEHSALAWINALAAVIESMEARNRGR